MITVHATHQEGPPLTKKILDRPRLRVSYNHKGPTEHMGRFGGGWQYSLGFEAGHTVRQLRAGRPTTIIVNLLVFYLRFDFNPRRGR